MILLLDVLQMELVSSTLTQILGKISTFLFKYALISNDVIFVARLFRILIVQFINLFKQYVNTENTDSSIREERVAGSCYLF